MLLSTREREGPGESPTHRSQMDPRPTSCFALDQKCVPRLAIYTLRSALRRGEADRGLGRSAGVVDCPLV